MVWFGSKCVLITTPFILYFQTPALLVKDVQTIIGRTKCESTRFRYHSGIPYACVQTSLLVQTIFYYVSDEFELLSQWNLPLCF